MGVTRAASTTTSISMSNILVTGSSSGFGYATVIALAERGHTVFATMRDPARKNRTACDELNHLAKTRRLAIHVLDLDVTSDVSVTKAVETAIANAGELDVVVNNAGYLVGGLAETATAQQLLALLDTNVVGMHRVNRAVLPAMCVRHSGLLIHVSSTLGRTLMPCLGVYAASKWAVEALAETYRTELKPTGVDVAIVQPGANPTSLFAKLQVGSDAERAAAYGPLAGAFAVMQKQLEPLFTMADAPRPRDVADAIVTLVESPAGKRPARLVVARHDGDATRALNDAHARVQQAIVQGLGLAFLAD